MTALDEIAKLIRRKSGVDLKPAQRNSLRMALGRVAPGTHPRVLLHRARDPVHGRETIARLIDEITVQESYFLRDHAQLAAIDWELLLERARATGGTIRVWSAACATGEEPFSLALLACEAFGTSTPPVRILGTDVSRAALDQASTGAYRERSLRGLTPELRARYFHPQADRLAVGDRLRDLVSFARHNLVRDPSPPSGEAPFHLILCRNTLIYFEAATAERVVGALENALEPPGVLILGAADALCVTGLRSPTPAPAGSATELEGEAAPPRRPLGREAGQSPAERLSRAVQAADSGLLEEAIHDTSELLRDDPLNADAYFLQGIAQLEAGNPQAAVKSLRGALYLFPTFGAAAFKLGGAYEALGEGPAALRAYEQALRTIERDRDRHEPVLEQVELGDIAAACEARIVALR